MHIDVENVGNSSPRLIRNKHNEAVRFGNQDKSQKEPHKDAPCLFGEISATFRFGTAPTSANAERSPARSRTQQRKCRAARRFSDLGPLEVQVGAPGPRRFIAFRYGFVLILNLWGPNRSGSAGAVPPWRSTTQERYVLRLPLPKTALGPKSGVGPYPATSSSNF